MGEPLQEGYAVSRSHISYNALKTNCPMTECIRIAKELQQCDSAAIVNLQTNIGALAVCTNSFRTNSKSACFQFLGLTAKSSQNILWGFQKILTDIYMDDTDSGRSRVSYIYKSRLKEKQVFLILEILSNRQCSIRVLVDLLSNSLVQNTTIMKLNLSRKRTIYRNLMDETSI